MIDLHNSIPLESACIIYHYDKATTTERDPAENAKAKANRTNLQLYK